MLQASCFLIHSMGKILYNQDIHLIQKAKKSGDKLVLVGGCFDVLHTAHIEFLKKARKEGDALIVLLESDKKIRELKGESRPINSQNDRAAALSKLNLADYILNLTYLKTNRDYEILVKKIEPDIIAITRGNRVYDWEREYVEKTGKRIVEVMDRKEDYSTTKIINIR